MYNCPEVVGIHGCYGGLESIIVGWRGQARQHEWLGGGGTAVTDWGFMVKRCAKSGHAAGDWCQSGGWAEVQCCVLWELLMLSRPCMFYGRHPHPPPYPMSLLLAVALATIPLCWLSCCRIPSCRPSMLTSLPSSPLPKHTHASTPSPSGCSKAYTLGGRHAARSAAGLLPRQGTAHFVALRPQRPPRGPTSFEPPPYGPAGFLVGGPRGGWWLRRHGSGPEYALACRRR